jgi:hypothetical protein
MPHRHRLARSTRALALTLAATAVFATAALATTSPTQTRDGYTEAVEPICKTDSKANERLLTGVRKQIKAGQLKPAAARFAKAAIAFGKGTSQIARVPQPTADAGRLTEWIGLLRNEATILRKISKALAAGKKGAATHESAVLSQNGSKANVTVLAFEFNYCKIEQSRFE